MSDKTDKFFHSHGIDMDKPISEINSARTLAESRKKFDRLLEESGKIAVAEDDGLAGDTVDGGADIQCAVAVVADINMQILVCHIQFDSDFTCP